MDPLDTALGELRNLQHPFFGSNHGPMAAEAMVSLGYGERAPEWARLFSKDLVALDVKDPLDEGDWRSALGEGGKLGSWVAFFERELARSSWQETARHWLPRLLPAISCWAAHGVIRVAHALRSLSSRETPARVHELAEALGEWAAHYRTLPGSEGGGSPKLASEAIAAVPFRPHDEQGWQGSISERLDGTGAVRGFAEAASAICPPADLASFHDDLARTSALLYLANAPRARVIDFIHAVDGVTAIRELLPYLSGDDARRALFFGWQLVAALHAVSGGPLRPQATQPPDPDEVASLVERAVDVGGAHALKFAQACLIEYDHSQDPIFHTALADMVERMEKLKSDVGIVI